MTQIRKTSFITLLAADVRRRHEHTRVGNRVTSFIVQIEILLDGTWTAVVRYDTAHGFAHRDLILPDGQVDKTPLFLQTFNEALDFAEKDIRINWQSYKERYLKRRKNLE